jgi:DNA-binding transcriptional LysR family regulator
MYNQINAIDVNGLILFHELASSASLRQAASRLRVPAATVSRKLRELERDLGAVLFKRGQRRMTLTDAGVALLEHSGKIVAAVDSAQNALSELQSEPHGCIRVSLPFGFGTNLVSIALARFALAHPHMELVIQATNRDVDVTADPVDIAFTVGPVHNESLPAVKISELHRGVYGSTDYCAANGIPLKPADLLKFQCIPLETQRSAGLWTFGAGGRRVSAKARICVTDVNTAFNMMRAGLGFAILPNFLCRDAVKSGAVRRVLPNWSIPPLPVTATYLERRHVPLRIRVFLDFIRKEIKPLTKSL